MRVRPLSELAAVDELTQRFTPHGFGLDRILTPDSAAEFHQHAIAEADLVDAVPTEVRVAYESVRTCHSYGVLSYELFGIAANLSFTVLERALRTRFLEFYDGVVPVENSSGATTSIPVRSFEDVHDGFRLGGVHHKQGWQLKITSSGQRSRMPLFLAPLLAWARLEQLLDGQASRLHEARIPIPRNWFAHGEISGPGMPQESARWIHDLAEIINRLWGARTPRGRLYPAPLPRQVVALASSTFQGRRRLAVMGPAQIPDQLADAGNDATFLLVAAVPEDQKLLEFNSHYECTTYPADLLWGPGDGMHAHAWWKEHQPACTPIDHLDRLFAIQVHDGKVYLPRQPETAFGLPPDKRLGTWHVVQADEPTAAFVHVRNVVNGSCTTTREPRCSCAINELTTGSWRDIKYHLDPDGVFPPTGPPISLPPLFPLPSSVGSD